MTFAVAAHILVDKAGGVLTLTLNRPEKKNALTRAMYRTISDTLDGAGEDPDVRCILIQAAGDAFTAGNDLADFAAEASGESDALLREGNPLLAALPRTRKPLVAAVQGRAVGVGVTLLLHCDLVFVAEDAVLTTPFVNLALVPEAASSLLLPARIGHVRAFSMFVLGEAVDGPTAVAWGIANAAVPAGDLRARARAAAEAIAAKPPAAVAKTRTLMRDEPAVVAQLAREGEHFLAQLRSPEAREAFAAFAEKRAPDFGKVAS